AVADYSIAVHIARKDSYLCGRTCYPTLIQPICQRGEKFRVVCPHLNSHLKCLVPGRQVSSYIPLRIEVSGEEREKRHVSVENPVRNAVLFGQHECERQVEAHLHANRLPLSERLGRVVGIDVPVLAK